MEKFNYYSNFSEWFKKEIKPENFLEEGTDGEKLEDTTFLDFKNESITYIKLEANGVATWWNGFGVNRGLLATYKTES